MNETYWCSDNSCRMCLSLTYQFTKFHKGCRRISKGKQGIGMFLYSQTDTCLCAGDTLLLCHLSHAWIGQITLSLNTQTL